MQDLIELDMGDIPHIGFCKDIPVTWMVKGVASYPRDVANLLEQILLSKKMLPPGCNDECTLRVSTDHIVIFDVNDGCITVTQRNVNTQRERRVLRLAEVVG